MGGRCITRILDEYGTSHRCVMQEKHAGMHKFVILWDETYQDGTGE